MGKEIRFPGEWHGEPEDVQKDESSDPVQTEQGLEKTIEFPHSRINPAKWRELKEALDLMRTHRGPLSMWREIARQQLSRLTDLELIKLVNTFESDYAIDKPDFCEELIEEIKRKNLEPK